MRAFFTFLILVATAGVAHATETKPAAEARDVPLPRVETRSVNAPELSPVLEAREVAKVSQQESPAAAAQPPRNWLWTVAAIVVAGVILAVIL